jgi:hypothetical protein
MTDIGIPQKLNDRYGSSAAPQNSTIPMAAIEREAEVRADFSTTEI